MTIKTHSDTHIAKKRWYIERVWGAAKRRKNISRFAAGRRHLPVQTHAECVEKHLPFFYFLGSVYICAGVLDIGLHIYSLYSSC
jgi:hypothetical protein